MQHRLPDGRRLAYEEYGDRHGKPVFFFHGMPGSRLFRPPDEVTRRMGVRLFCVDRPGYGGSTFQANRRIVDWPIDVASLADALQLDTFAVAGHSGGGPYALACAYSILTRVSSAAILSGAGPVDAPGAAEGLTSLHWLAFKLGRHIPWSLTRLLVWLFFHKAAADPVRAIDLDSRGRSPADDEVLKLPSVREICIESDVEAYRQGLPGFAWDVRLITRPWRFELEEIKIPVTLWHGTADDFTTTGMARYMAEKIPNSNLFICEGEGHMLLVPHWEDILTSLTSASG